MCKGIKLVSAQKARLLGILCHEGGMPPVLVVQMKRSNLDDYLIIPKAFARKWLRRTKKTLYLKDDVGTYNEVLSYKMRKDKRGLIFAGWRAFLRFHELQEGSFVAFKFNLFMKNEPLEVVT